jgi:hypothetical protein
MLRGPRTEAAMVDDGRNAHVQSASIIAVRKEEDKDEDEEDGDSIIVVKTVFCPRKIISIRFSLVFGARGKDYENVGRIVSSRLGGVVV